MLALLLMVWDGFHIIGEGFGLTRARADRFADTLWLGTAVLTGTWLASLVILAGPL